MKLLVREAEFGDAELLAPRLRAADRQEIAAASGEHPLTALHHGFSLSEPAFTIEGPDGLAGMFGVVPSGQIGVPWLLGSDDIRKHRREFLERAPLWFKAVSCTYAHLANWIDERNELHIRWIRWLGFSITGRDPHFGHEGRPFLYFEWHYNSDDV